MFHLQKKNVSYHRAVLFLRTGKDCEPAVLLHLLCETAARLRLASDCVVRGTGVYFLSHSGFVVRRGVTDNRQIARRTDRQSERNTDRPPDRQTER